MPLTDYFTRLADQGLVPVTHNPLKGDVFVDITIECHRFKGAVANDPYIMGVNPAGDCALGVCSIACCSDFRHRDGPRWHICKYDNQWRIDVAGLSDAGRRTLAHAFGLYLAGEPYLGDEASLFFASQAGAALRAWLQAHPRKAARYAGNAYLGDWVGWARDPNWKEPERTAL